MKKLAVIITHPIQYYSPLFQLLSERNKIKIKVFYTWEQSKEKFFDKKFGREIKWDIPLLDGYDYTFVKNIARKPGSGHFSGVINPTLIKEIKNWQADAVLVFGWNHQSHFKAMRYFKGKIPVYFRGDSTLIDYLPGFKKLARKAVLTFVYKFIDKAFYVGTNNKRYFLEYGLKEDRLIFAPHVVDNDRFAYPSARYEEEAQKKREEWGIEKNDTVFLFAGKFEPKKNPLILINAAKSFPEYKFLFAGNGVLEKKMKEKASKNTVFIPFQNQSQMPVLYHVSDIFVLPSQGPGETWGLAVNEAMACGKAVIVSDKTGCYPDLIKNGKNGYVFKSGNLSDLNEKISLAGKKHDELGKYSAKLIKDFTIDLTTEIIEKNI